MSMFTKATRRKAKLRLALCGTSGSGKTYSALLIAKGIGGKVALIDTENRSASLYEGLAEFDVCEVQPPFTVQKYIDAIKAAEAEGYKVLIIDSLTHAWAGQGGLLEEVDRKAAASRSKNSYAAWREITPLHNQLVDTILQSQMHVIVTMRTKTAYEMEKDDRGKVTPVKMGMAPIQRDGLEYEFTVVLDVENTKHMATSGKDRTGLFDGKVFVPDEDTGKQLNEWLEQGVDAPATKQQLQNLAHEAKKVSLSGDDMKEIMLLKYSISSSSDLTMKQAEEMGSHLEQYWNDVIAIKGSIESSIYHE